MQPGVGFGERRQQGSWATRRNRWPWLPRPLCGRLSVEYPGTGRTHTLCTNGERHRVQILRQPMLASPTTMLCHPTSGEPSSPRSVIDRTSASQPPRLAVTPSFWRLPPVLTLIDGHCHVGECRRPGRIGGVSTATASSSTTTVTNSARGPSPPANATHARGTRSSRSRASARSMFRVIRFIRHAQEPYAHRQPVSSRGRVGARRLLPHSRRRLVLVSH